MAPLEPLVQTRAGAKLAEAFMDKGILKFMAEAYLLLHSGSTVHSDAADDDKVPKQEKQRRSGRSTNGDSKTKAPAKA
jgi:hypothetical protein